MAATVVLTERAVRDIREIERFSKVQWGRKTADKYLDDIESALDRLSKNPVLLRNEPEITANVSLYRVRRHMLVCDYRDKILVVLTVIHSVMDLPARLAELAPNLATEAQLLREKLHGRHRSN